MSDITVIGAGLAGCEAAWQAAQMGANVKLIEMKPQEFSPAHHSPLFAELVCSNSLRSDRWENGVGLLKEELRRMDSLLMQCADRSKVPAGGALAVDRESFSAAVTEAMQTHPRITVEAARADAIPDTGVVVIATGPLTQGGLFSDIEKKVDRGNLHFFDAAAPIVTSESIDRKKVFAMSRYGKGSDDYLNCPMNKEEYLQFYNALIYAEPAMVKDFDKNMVFEGCMPIETMAGRGEDTMRFGPLKPVGLIDPRTGKEPYACVQLRQDDAKATMYNIVGFQTRLKFTEQLRVFRMIPGLENAEFYRMGVMHRNTFLQSPGLLDRSYAWLGDSRIFFAGQMTGVEGYVESIGSGWVAGRFAALKIKGISTEYRLPEETMLGAMAAYISDTRIKKFQPMNANFGIIPPLTHKVRGKKERNMALAHRSLEHIEQVNSFFSPYLFTEA